MRALLEKMKSKLARETTNMLGLLDIVQEKAQTLDYLDYKLLSVHVFYKPQQEH